MLATYTAGDAILTVLVFLVWVAFIGVAIWLLIRLFRNKNFIADRRGLRIVVKVLLAAFALFVPLLGVPVLFVIWYSTRSRDPELPDADEGTREAPSTAPSADGAPYRRPLPFPPPSAPEDTGA